MQKSKLSFKSQIKDNPYFFYPYFLFLLIGIVLFIFTSDKEITIYINSYQNTYADYYFKFMTDLGDGTYFGIALIFVLFYRIKYVVLGLSTYLSHGLAVQIIKNLVDSPRPMYYFQNTNLLHLVPGVDYHLFNSFPSGHTASGFGIFLFLAILTKNKQLGILYFMLALSVGLSRIYLLQHYFIDVYFGSIIAVFLTILIYNLFENNKKMYHSKWYNFSIIKK